MTSRSRTAVSQTMTSRSSGRRCVVAAGYVREGKLRISHQDAFKAAIAGMPNCRILIRLEEHLDPLSAALRAYWWGVVIQHVTAETGFSDREAHLLMKELHTPMRFAAVRGVGRIDQLRVFDSSITDLSNTEQWEVIENVQQWAAERLNGLVIPDPIAPGVIAA